jgi:hypothetical protein
VNNTPKITSAKRILFPAQFPDTSRLAAIAPGSESIPFGMNRTF